jgi:sulfur carrier protein
VIVLNGQGSDLVPGVTIAEVLDGLGLDAQARGVAVAVDGAVVPRNSWPTFALDASARVEVLTAMQGG